MVLVSRAIGEPGPSAVALSQLGSHTLDRLFAQRLSRLDRHGDAERPPRRL